MTPIIAVFMSMISLLALVTDRANLQEQGESIPLPSVDDGVSRNFLDVAKRTLPLKMTPSRSMTLRRVPRAIPRSGPTPGPGSAAAPSDIAPRSGPTPSPQPDRRIPTRFEAGFGPPSAAASPLALGPSPAPEQLGDVVLHSLLLRALSKRDVRDQLWGSRSPKKTSSTTKKPLPRSRARATRPAPHKGNSLGHHPPGPTLGALGELEDDLMVHGRDRDQLRRRWKIENAGNRVANVHG